jgi:hypothetical protein
MGASERKVEGSRYKCTSSEVESSPSFLETPTTGHCVVPDAGDSLTLMSRLMRVLFPAPV